MKRVRAYITVYLTLVIGVLLVLVLMIMDGVRRQTVRYETEYVMDAGMNSIFAEYHRKMYERYGLLFIDDAYGGSCGSTENTKVHLLSYMNINFENAGREGKELTDIRADNGQIDKVSFATDKDGTVLRYQILRLSETNGSNSYDRALLSDLDEQLDKYDIYCERREEVNNRIKEIEEEINQRKRAAKEDEITISTIADSVETLSQDNALAYALGSGVELTAAIIEPDQYISHRDYTEGYGLYEGQEDPYGEIAEQKFISYVLEECGYFDHPREGSRLNYQVEYILEGEAEDLINLSLVASDIFKVRYSVNMDCLMSNGSMQEEAYREAEAAVAVYNNEELTQCVRDSILLAWGYAESAADVRRVFDGGGVAKCKTSGSWNIPLSELGDFKNRLSTAGGGNSEIKYEDYLAGFLNLLSEREQNLRLMDIFEMDIRMTEGNSNFKADNLIYQLEAKVNVSSGYGYAYDICRQFSYD